MSAGADQVGSSSGWVSIETAPDADSSARVWVLGGRYREPTLMWANGAYWRFEAQALPGCSRTPTLWHANAGGWTPPEMPPQEMIAAHAVAVPADEPDPISKARAIWEETDPNLGTPMEYVGYLRNRGGGENKAKADRIEKAMRDLASERATRSAA
ncbi:hypothetical protein [Methylobacterium sp. 1030]|uniref:hypothetical protein n=1 Tax=Methylobacterium sp. 1030 TaxID=3156404 RepID=UPI00339AAA28